MLEKKYIRALLIIHKLFERNDIQWALIGSANMHLQGMDVLPKDLDLVVNLEDLEKIPSLLSNFEASPVKEASEITDRSAWEVKAKIEDVDVQILAEEKNSVYGRELVESHLKMVRLMDIVIPCFSLGIEAKVYEETKRHHKADLIHKFMRSS